MKRLPKVLEKKVEGEHAHLSLLVEPDLAWFKGHFDGHPILAGVVQVAWVAHYAREIYGLGEAVNTLDQVKFRRPIVPGRRVELKLTHRGELLRYEYSDADGAYSSGSLGFAAGD